MSSTAADHLRAQAEVAITVLVDDGERVLTAPLNNTPAARAQVEQLPLRLRFTDFNAVEKLARLPRPLSLVGVPDGDDPGPGDVGFYAPTGHLVLYYRDGGYWPGTARLGRFSNSAEAFLAGMDEDFDAVISVGD